MFILGSGHCLYTGPARAQALHESASGVQSRARVEVVLGVVGLRAPAQHDSLIGLLNAELGGMSLLLVEHPPSPQLSVWASEAVRSERTLLAILLDARGDQGWRLVVIDAARGRAIVRELPGGIQQDAASIEAVVSIVVSAASALRDGLEVASSPLEAVVGASPMRRKSPRRAGSRDVGGNALSGQHSSLHASVGASMATFSPQAVTTSGLALALGVAWRGQLEARVFGALFWPAEFRTAFGEFEVNRALLGAAAGPRLKLRMFYLVPEAGIVLERLRRAETTPAAGVLATEGTAVYRVGGVLALRLRLPLSQPLSVELGTGAAYFGRRAQFWSSAPAASQLAEVWPVAAFAQLGVQVATP